MGQQTSKSDRRNRNNSNRQSASSSSSSVSNRQNTQVNRTTNSNDHNNTTNNNSNLINDEDFVHVSDVIDPDSFKGYFLLIFGENKSGQLGTGIASERPVASLTTLQINANTRPKQIACGDYFTALITQQGDLLTWGDNERGQLGRATNESKSPASMPLPVTLPRAFRSTPIRRVACGADFLAVVLSNGTLLTCGNGSSGVLAHGDTKSRSTLRVVERNGTAVLAVSCGERHMLVMHGDGTLYAAGANDAAQLSLPLSVPRSTHLQPVEHFWGLAISSFSCGAMHNVAVANGFVFAWGSNQHAQLAAASQIVKSPTPITVPLDAAPVYAVCGGDRSVVVMKNGSLRHWGRSTSNNVVRQPQPIDELSSTPALQVALGASLSLVVTKYQEQLKEASDEVEPTPPAHPHSAVEVSAPPVEPDAPPPSYAAAVNDALRPDDTVNDNDDDDDNDTHVPPSNTSHDDDDDNDHDDNDKLTQSATSLQHDNDQHVNNVLNSDVNDDHEHSANPVATATPRHLFHCWTREPLEDSFISNLKTGAQSSESISQPSIDGGVVLPYGAASFGVACGRHHVMMLATTDESIPASIPLPGASFQTLSKSSIVDSVSRIKQLSSVGDVANHRIALTELSKKLTTVFSSVRLLSLSFLDERGRLSMHDLRAAYIALAELAAKEVTDAFTTALTTLSDVLSLRPEAAAGHAFELRCILVWLESPYLLAVARDNAPLLVRFLAAILALPTPLYTTLLQRLRMHSSDFFIMPVVVCNTLITTLLRSTTGVNLQHFATPARMLNDLFRLNETARIVSYESFYNALCNTPGALNLQTEYWKWRNGAESICRYPFLLSAVTKSEILKIDAEMQMKQQIENAIVMSAFTGIQQSPYLILVIRRESIVDDTLHQIASKPPFDLKKPLKVKFADEDAIDAGGVSKEFFHLLTQKLFDVQYGMFTYNKQTRLFWFNTSSSDQEREFQLIGILLGLAIYNSVIININFPRVVYKKLCNNTATFEDLKESHPVVARNLKQLLEYEGDDVDDVFGLDFRLTFEEFGALRHVDLVPNGDQVDVTVDNRQQYVDLYVEYLLNKSIDKQFTALRKGFELVVGGAALGLFRNEEIELLICGAPDFDIGELEKHATYKGYQREDVPVQWFWQIMKEYPEKRQREVLSYVTGSDRVPIAGFAALKFVVYKAGDDAEVLPGAATCFNTFYLPAYKSKRKLFEKLEKALEFGSEGFGVK